MTQNEKRIAIANACGIHWVEAGRLDIPNATQLWDCHWADSKTLQKLIDGSLAPCRCELPDYFGSLDAMHEAEKFLTDNQFSCYGWTLLQSEPNIECRRYLSATAEQRAESFGKTLNLW